MTDSEDEVEEVVTPAADILAIKDVWEHLLIKKIRNEVISGNTTKEIKTWQCLAEGCNMVFNDWNATKALAHGCKLQQYCIQTHVKMCAVPTSGHALKLSRDLYAKKGGVSDAKKSGANAV